MLFRICSLLTLQHYIKCDKAGRPLSDVMQLDATNDPQASCLVRLLSSICGTGNNFLRLAYLGEAKVALERVNLEWYKTYKYPIPLSQVIALFAALMGLRKQPNERFDQLLLGGLGDGPSHSEDVIDLTGVEGGDTGVSSDLIPSSIPSSMAPPAGLSTPSSTTSCTRSFSPLQPYIVQPSGQTLARPPIPETPPLRKMANAVNNLGLVVCPQPAQGSMPAMMRSSLPLTTLGTSILRARLGPGSVPIPPPHSTTPATPYSFVPPPRRRRSRLSFTMDRLRPPRPPPPQPPKSSVDLTKFSPGLLRMMTESPERYETTKVALMCELLRRQIEARNKGGSPEVSREQPVVTRTAEMTTSQAIPAPDGSTSLARINAYHPIQRAATTTTTTREQTLQLLPVPGEEGHQRMMTGVIQVPISVQILDTSQTPDPGSPSPRSLDPGSPNPGSPCPVTSRLCHTFHYHPSTSDNHVTQTNSPTPPESPPHLELSNSLGHEHLQYVYTAGETAYTDLPDDPSTPLSLSSMVIKSEDDREHDRKEVFDLGSYNPSDPITSYDCGLPTTYHSHGNSDASIQCSVDLTVQGGPAPVYRPQTSHVTRGLTPGSSGLPTSVHSTPDRPRSMFNAQTEFISRAHNVIDNIYGVGQDQYIHQRALTNIPRNTLTSGSSTSSCSGKIGHVSRERGRSLLAGEWW